MSMSETDAKMSFAMQSPIGHTATNDNMMDDSDTEADDKYVPVCPVTAGRNGNKRVKTEESVEDLEEQLRQETNRTNRVVLMDQIEKMKLEHAEATMALAISTTKAKVAQKHAEIVTDSAAKWQERELQRLDVVAITKLFDNLCHTQGDRLSALFGPQ